MFTFKEFLLEVRDEEKTKEHLTNLANHPSTGEGERTAAKAALERLGNKPKPKEPEKKPEIDHKSGDWKKTHMFTKPNGERRYVSHSLSRAIHKTHNRSETEVRYHKSEKEATQHLKSQGFTNVHHSISAGNKDIRVAKKSKKLRTTDQFNQSGFYKKVDRYPDKSGKYYDN